MAFSDIFKIEQYKSDIAELQQQNEFLLQKLNNLGADEYYQVKENINTLEKESQQLKERITILKEESQQQTVKIESLRSEESTLIKNINSQTNKLRRIKELYKSIEHCITNFFNYSPQIKELKLPQTLFEESEKLAPTVMTQLHCMSMKDLQKAYKENDKQIDELMKNYATFYTTKANITIYNLMIIALRAELQNILTNLRYEKKDVAIKQVKTVTAKYLAIANSANSNSTKTLTKIIGDLDSLLINTGTLTKFIGELEALFINAVEIEYNYYVKKEQAKQEQAAIREQMKQEAEERKALEAEKKKVEKEESKYNAEIAKLNEQISSANEKETLLLQTRIAELQAQLSNVATKKQEIIALANGKAGNVYVISNLGAFGENVFKIGMTRRLDPLERINELGNASVPFKFDVHCFIFSEDAVSLENKLHETLNEKRVNKVNLRKEFFRTSIDELETLVYSIDPTAEFNKTMAAEEYRQSLSSDFVYTSQDISLDEEDE